MGFMRVFIRKAVLVFPFWDKTKKQKKSFLIISEFLNILKYIWDSKVEC